MAITGTEGRVSDGGGRGCDDNIILNPEFDSGLDGWSGSGCKIELHDSLDDGKVLPVSGKHFVAATGRTDTWNGVMQDVTARLQRKTAYEVAATVRLAGTNVSPCEVQATLSVQTTDGRQQYIGVGKYVYFSRRIAVICSMARCVFSWFLTEDVAGCRRQTRTGRSCRGSSC